MFGYSRDRAGGGAGGARASPLLAEKIINLSKIHFQK